MEGPKVPESMGLSLFEKGRRGKFEGIGLVPRGGKGKAWPRINLLRQFASVLLPWLKNRCV